jgi:hypothetical protein
MFDWGHINFKAKLGWLNWLTHILNSVAAAGALAWIVSEGPQAAAVAAAAAGMYLCSCCSSV